MTKTDKELMAVPLSEPELFARIKELGEQRMALLSRGGHVPREGTKRRDEFDALADRITNLTYYWNVADAMAKSREGEKA